MSVVRFEKRPLIDFSPNIPEPLDSDPPIVVFIVMLAASSNLIVEMVVFSSGFLRRFERRDGKLMEMAWALVARTRTKTSVSFIAVDEVWWPQSFVKRRKRIGKCNFSGDSVRTYIVTWYLKGSGEIL
jgi:hypothetical protein